MAVYDRVSDFWSVLEEDLETTGRYDRDENVYDETTITVSAQNHLARLVSSPQDRETVRREMWAANYVETRATPGQ